MPKIEQEKSSYLSQKNRLIALGIYVLLLVLVCKLVSGEWFPAESGKRLWFLSGIGLWVFVLLSAPWFRPPRDSLANAVVAGLLLSFLDFQGVNLLKMELSAFRWIAVGFAVVTAVAAVVAMALREADPILRPRLGYMSKLTFRISDALGRGEIVFTPPALISIIGYYQAAPFQQLWLLFFWVFIVVVRPVELAFRLIAQIRSIGPSNHKTELIGTISRVDNPNIVRVALEAGSLWMPNNIVVACLPNSHQVYVLPLFYHVQESQLVGTGLFHGYPGSPIPEAVPGHVYLADVAVEAREIIKELSGLDNGAELIGFVVEDSNISAIRFEVSPDFALEEGMLTFCREGEQTVYYQILDARTAEEAFEKNPRGKHIAIAAKLGCLDAGKGFVKYGWLPAMNSPVFIPKEPVKFDAAEREVDEFEIGKIPGSEISVRAGFFDMFEFHSAIIGVTGTGKTEFVFDVIKQALLLDTKVFCVDFTEEYKTRLADHAPQSLGLEEDKANELDQKLFAVDTGEYGARKEKEALKIFVDSIKDPVMQSVEDFLSSDGPSLGIFELPEITNTKATLRATELYLSSIMDWARKNRRARRILIVLEEAHTIIPETVGSGFDYDTQWIVGRISQIALQGRKYGVGLLVISQRTALVSKSILSQCNTYFAFSLMDKTSLDYLSNVYSPEHVRSIPNLRFLEVIAYGKAVRSERPLLIKLEYDETKKIASDALSKTLSKQNNVV